MFDLIFYQGLSHAEAAALLGISTKTVQRRWQEACMRLYKALGGRLPRTVTRAADAICKGAAGKPGDNQDAGIELNPRGEAGRLPCPLPAVRLAGDAAPGSLGRLRLGAARPDRRDDLQGWHLGNLGLPGAGGADSGLAAHGFGAQIGLGVFGPGEVFGEYALLPPHLNTATCRAARPGRLLRLPLLPLQPFTRRPEVQANLKSWLRLNVLVGFLRERAFLGFMSADSSLPLLDRCQEISFPDGHTIQADGLGDDRWHFIRAGQIHLQPVVGGGPPTLLGPGDCFGERALLGRAGLPVAVARGEVRCLTLPRANFGPSPRHGGQPGIQTTCQHPGGEQSFPWVGQQEAGDCGVAALAMIACYHGRQVDFGKIRGLVDMGESGASMLGLQQAATALGCPAGQCG